MRQGAERETAEPSLAHYFPRTRDACSWFEEIQRPPWFPAGRLPQNCSRFIPDVLRDDRFLRGIATIQSGGLHQQQSQTVVTPAEVILFTRGTSDVELAAVE